MNVCMTMQVADVQKALAPTAKVCDAGNMQVFTKSGGWIIGNNESKHVLAAIDKAVRKLEMKRTGDVYTYDIYVKKSEQDKANERNANANRYHALGSVEEGEEVQNSERAQDFTRLGDELV